MTADTTLETLEIIDQRPDHAELVEALCDRAFGPGREAKTSYRLREGGAPIAELCRIALAGGVPVGSIRYWPIRIDDRPALLLGPLAVEPVHKNRGIGLALMRESLARARAAGHRLVILVGDLPYYARVGFSRIPEGRVTLPGPVDAERLLYLELEPGAFAGVSGMAAALSGPRDTR